MSLPPSLYDAHPELFSPPRPPQYPPLPPQSTAPPPVYQTPQPYKAPPPLPEPSMPPSAEPQPYNPPPGAGEPQLQPQRAPQPSVPEPLPEYVPEPYQVPAPKPHLQLPPKAPPTEAEPSESSVKPTDVVALAPYLGHDPDLNKIAGLPASFNPVAKPQAPTYSDNTNQYQYTSGLFQVQARASFHVSLQIEASSLDPLDAVWFTVEVWSDITLQKSLPQFNGTFLGLASQSLLKSEGFYNYADRNPPYEAWEFAPGVQSSSCLFGAYIPYGQEQPQIIEIDTWGEDATDFLNFYNGRIANNLPVGGYLPNQLISYAFQLQLIEANPPIPQPVFKSMTVLILTANCPL